MKPLGWKKQIALAHYVANRASAPLGQNKTFLDRTGWMPGQKSLPLPVAGELFLLTSPFSSKKNVKTFLDGIRRIIRSGLHLSAGDLISELNPKIRGWANYHQHMASSRTFEHVDHVIFHTLRRWARRRHPKKSPSWLKQKYFERHRGLDWCFSGETYAGDGQPIKIWLQRAGSTLIKRHIKVKGEANPYDPVWESYFAQREGAQMLASFRGRSMLRYLWYSQRGLCPLCKMKITHLTGWRMQYCLPRTLGGSTSAENRVLLHPECYRTVQHQGRSVSKPHFLGSVRRA